MTESGANSRSPFGKLLIDFRTAAGLSQNQLAARVDIATRSIAAYESAQASASRFRLPHLHNLKTLASALSLTEDDQARLVEAYEKTQACKRGLAPKRSQSGFLEEGREHHIRTLQQAWERTKTGSPQVVIVSGDSDIGKSSLIRHVSDEIAANESDVMFAWGEASSWATNAEPYTVFRRAMDHLLGSPKMTAGAPARYLSRPTLLPQHVYRVMKAWPGLNDVLVSAGVMRDVIQQVPRGRQQELLEQLRTASKTNANERSRELTALLIDLAQSWPIVLVLEDLHWAGTLTCQLLTYLVRRLDEESNCPIMIVASYRNHDLHADENAPDHPLLHALESVSSLPHVSTVSLNDVLSPQNGSAFVKALVATNDVPPGKAEELTAWILENSSGHPLISKELLSHALLHGNGASVPVEHTLNSDSAMGTMLRQRLRPISAKGKRVLDVASVMGAAILPTTIATVLNTSFDDVITVIEDELMAQQGLLRPGPVLAASPPVETFAFVHTLFQDYIYGNINAARRLRLHKQIAAHLEEILSHADTTALDIISRHLVKAENWYVASGLFHKRAQLHMGRLDHDLARADLDIAADYAQRSADNYQLTLIRSTRVALLRATMEYDEALDLAKSILEITSWNDWPLIEAVTHHYLGEIHFDLSRLDTAECHLKTAVEMYLELGEDIVAGGAESMLSHTLMRKGHYDTARTYAERALQHVRTVDNSWVKPEAMLALANCDLEIGAYERAMEGLELVAELGRMMGKRTTQLIPAVNTGLCLVQLARYEEALKVLNQTVIRLKSPAMPRLLSHALLYKGYVYEKLGDLKNARTMYQAALDQRLKTSCDARTADSQAGLVRVAIAEGNTKNVAAYLQTLEDGIESTGVDGVEELMLVQMTRARAARHLGDEAKYDRLIREAHATLMGRASKLVDEDARRSYLESVPINRELNNLYTALKTG